MSLWVFVAPKFQPTKGGAQRRNERPEPIYHLWDEASESEEEVQEIGAKGSNLAYRTRFTVRQQAIVPSMMRKMNLHKIDLAEMG
ncbi:hypothetical protein HAX54_014984 [Datura stramonium]|uniref:Uncharacterized protein n=1 Tax=Datura stramonium TaxID=4076 RepID=A0ABS8TQW4_DATST|nr:hypothetical protein [Datura stramonium]